MYIFGIKAVQYIFGELKRFSLFYCKFSVSCSLYTLLIIAFRLHLKCIKTADDTSETA